MLRDQWRALIAQSVRLVRGYALNQPQERAAFRWFRDRGDSTLRLVYPLDAQSVVLDCGGFEGDWAAEMSRRYGCTVLVFEPVPSFCEGLKRRFLKYPNVRAYCFGLHSKDEMREIALAGNASSVFGVKTADSSNTQVIELRDVSEVFRELSIAEIALAKINIEGGEYDLLERLIETGLISRIRHVQVQFHRFVPDAERRRNAIREVLARTHTEQFNYEFIWESWARR